MKFWRTRFATTALRVLRSVYNLARKKMTQQNLNKKGPKWIIKRPQVALSKKARAKNEMNRFRNL
jgi:hypothetical protein